MHCVPNDKIQNIITFCHTEPCGGYLLSKKIEAKILQYRFHWPIMFRDTYKYCKHYESYQKLDAPTRKNDMPL